ncbi:MAG: GLUG motif-containing protein [Eubacteriales bacterium]|nr:GLUG motif-containing protein [Eubacteriales bacterium]
MNKTAKRLVSVLLALLLLASLIPAAFASAEEGEIHIRTAGDLLALAESCSLDTWSDGLKVVLDNDLSLAGTDFDAIPIFNGSFDGRGHTIYDLNLTHAQSPCGFFLETGPDASIIALNLSGTVAPRGDDSMVGGLAGRNRGTITACSFTGTVSAKSQVGGLVGLNEASGVVTACTASGSVSGLSATGGVCGCNAGTLAACTSSAYVNTESVDPALRLDAIDTSSILNFFKSVTTDNAGVTTDTGGIAGTSTGFVERCANSGPVGYLHLGYNVGGVVGRSSGYVNACTNSGEVWGRRDVGGIVGQLEPFIELQQAQDMLAGLTYRINALHDSIDSAISDASAYSAGLADHLSTLPGYLTPVAEALHAIDPMDQESILGLKDVIAGCVEAMSGSMEIIAGEVGDGSSVMTSDLEEINGNLSALSGAAMQTLTLLSGDEEPDILSDDSDLDDTSSVILGKIEDGVNSGTINGDSNVGGIVGSVSIENDLDPEGNLNVSHSRLTKNKLSMRAVVKHCVSRGAVTAKRECAGGVAGRMDIGLVTNSAGFGSVAIEDGAYAGGICGLCYGNVHSSCAKCSLSCAKYVGGIVGNGYNAKKDDESSSQITGCYSLVEILGDPQFAGAVAGGSEGVYADNYFVPAGWAGMDKLSIHGKAEPMDFASFASVEGLPEECRSFTLSFVVDGVTVKELPFSYGDSFDRSVFPQVEKRDGAYAVWDRTDLTNLRFDTVVTAEYRMDETVLRSALSREDGRAAVYVDGQFQSGDSLSLEVLEIPDNAIDSFRGDWKQTVREQLDSFFRDHEPDWSVCVGVEEMLRLCFPDDGTDMHTVRYLTPDARTVNHRLYLRSGDGYERVHPGTFGSYYTVEVRGTEAELVLVDTIQSWWIAAYIAGGLLVLALLTVLVVKLSRWLKKHRKAERTPPAWVLRTRAWNAAHKKQLRLGGAALLLAALAALVILRFSSIATAIDTYRILSDFASQETAIQTDIEVHSDARDLVLSDSIVRVRKNGKLIGCTDQYGIPLYFSSGIVYLENGRAFEVSGGDLDRNAVIDLARQIFRRGEIRKTRTGDETRYEAVLGPETANEILGLILSGDSADLLRAESMTVAMTARGSQLTGLFFSGGGETESGRRFSLSASLVPGPVEQRPVIPQAVLDAIELGGKGSREILSEDLLMLLAAWMKYDSDETAAAKIAVRADCGLLSVNTDYDYLRTRVDETDVHRIGSRLFAIYFTQDAACTENGAALGLAQQQVADTAKLIPMAKEICLKGDFDCHTVGRRRIYTVTLGRDAAAELASALIPELKTLKLELGECRLILTVSESELTQIELACAGTVRVVSRDVDSSVNVTASFSDPPANPSVPDAVRRTLLGEGK